MQAPPPALAVIDVLQQLRRVLDHRPPGPHPLLDQVEVLVNQGLRTDLQDRVRPRVPASASLVLHDLPPRIAKCKWVRCTLVHMRDSQPATPTAPFAVKVSGRIVNSVGNVLRDATHLLETDLPFEAMNKPSVSFRVRFGEICKNLGGKHVRLQVVCEAVPMPQCAVAQLPTLAEAVTTVTSREEREATGLAVYFGKGTFGTQYRERFKELGIQQPQDLARIPLDGPDFESTWAYLRRKQGPLTKTVLRNAINRARASLNQGKGLADDAQPATTLKGAAADEPNNEDDACASAPAAVSVVVKSEEGLGPAGEGMGTRAELVAALLQLRAKAF